MRATARAHTNGDDNRAYVCCGAKIRRNYVHHDYDLRSISAQAGTEMPRRTYGAHVKMIHHVTTIVLG